MPHTVTGAGLLSLVRDFEGRPKAETIAAAGYYRPNGRILYCAFYEALLAAKAAVSGQTVGQWQASLPAAPGEFRCYVADLAAYDSGRLIGEWIDLDGLSADEIRDAVAGVISRSPFPGAEEYAIHDWDGLPSSFGEWPDWEEVSAYVAAMAELGDSDREAFSAYVANIGATVSPDTLEEFREAYRGCYSSGEHYAQELAEEITETRDLFGQWPTSCIDWQAAWRQLEIGGDNWCEHGQYGCHVFRSV